MIRSRLIAAAAAAAILLGGCGTPDCLDSTDYLDSSAPSPLRIPEGLARPDRTGDMTIPGGLPVGGGSRGDNGRCLASPPEYYAVAGAPNPEGLPLRAADAKATPAPSGPGAGPAVGGSLVTKRVATFLADWAETWSRRDADAWFAFYAPDYAPAGYDTNGAWRQAQYPRFDAPARTAIESGTLEVSTEVDGTTRARFVQSFGQPPDVRRVVKEVAMVPDSSGFGLLIVDERIIDVL